MKKSYLQIIKLLDEFSSSFTRIGTLQQMALAVEEILEETYGVEYTGLYLFDPFEKRLKLLQAKGFSKEEFLAAEESALNRHPGLVFRTGKMLYIPDTLLDKDELSKSSQRSFEVRSRLYLPVKNGDEVVGAFGIVDSLPNAYNEEDVAILSFICNLSGALYANILNQNELKKMALIAKETANSAVIANKSGKIEWVNKAFTKITGYTLDEVKGKKPGDFLQGKETDKKTVAKLSEAIHKKQSIEVDIINYSKTKRKYWLNLQIQPVFDSSGELEYFISIQKEVTKEKEIEVKLRESESRFNKIFDSSPALMYVLKVSDRRITAVNDTMVQKTGMSREEIIGQLVTDIPMLAFNDGQPEILLELQKYQRIDRLEVQITTVHGEKLDGVLSREIIESYDQEYFLILITDITDIKLTESKLRASDSRIQAITDSAHDAILMMDNQGNISFWNPAAERIFGYTKKESIGKKLHDLIVPSRYHHAHHEAFPKFQQTGEGDAVGKTLDLQAIKKDGEEISIQMSLSAINVDGTWHSVGILRDISDRKRAEEELNKLFRAVEQSPVMTYITDLNGLIEYANPKVFDITGYTKEEILGKNPRIFSSGENSKEVYINLWQTISSGKEWKGDFHNKKKNGELYWVSASLSPVFDINGKLSHYIAVEEDITQQRENFEIIQIANLRFRSLISSMQSAVMVEDENRKIILVNQVFCDYFSIPLLADQLVGADCADLAEQAKFSFSDPDMFIKDINMTLEIHQIVTDFELHMVNGKTVERDFIPLDDVEKKNHGILWIFRDISDRKNSESNLMRQSHILSGTAQAMNYLLTIHDHDQAIQKALETIGLATGIDRVYIYEKSVDAKTGEAFFSQQFEWTARGIVPQIGNQELQNMPYSQNFPNWYNTLKSGKTVSGLTISFPESERRILEDEDIKSILAAPIFVDEQLWGMVGFDDCSIGIEWSTNEISIITALAGSLGGSISKRIVENELIEARHVAEYATKTKSDFLATMSHEIRTPMNGVIGMTSLLMQTSLTSDQRDYAETIRVSGELLLDVINDILDFSKIESGKMILEEQHFDLKLAIEDVFDLVTSSTYEKKLGLYFQVDPSIPQRITGDLTRLRQILVNLVGNAIKFTLKGEVVIRVNQLEISEDKAILEFSIRDTGVGIPQEKIGLLFKPFSQVDASTTRKFGGTGLGLAICAKLIGLMNGKIWVKSEVGQGTEFLFTIQTQYFKEKEISRESLTEINILKEKKVLIADSNESSRKFLFELLSSNDMIPYLADSREKALSILKSTNDINLVLIDDVLPLGAEALAYSVRHIPAYKEVPLILMIQPVLSESSVATDPVFQAKINKPLKHSQLIASIRNLVSKSIASKSPNLNQSANVQKINDQYPFNILVAEDNAINQKLISKLFEMLGYSIHIAANGFEVLDALKRMKIDIVFMDIQMPEMDGIEATRQIIAQWGDAKPLIVAMTANALYTDKDKCIAAGMDDYISKPLTITQVRNGIQQWASLIKSKDQSSEH
jgi:PAS domain S-box-containing protein